MFIFIIFKNTLEVFNVLRYNIYVYSCAVGGMGLEETVEKPNEAIVQFVSALLIQIKSDPIYRAQLPWGLSKKLFKRISFIYSFKADTEDRTAGQYPFGLAYP